MPTFGQRGLTGRQDQDQDPKQSKAKQERDTSSIYVTEPPLSRASSLPHGFAVFTISGDAQKPVGAGLLAKASAHPTSSQTNTPLSRASPLPHGVAGNHSICTQHKKLWERACSRWRQHSQHHSKLILRFREQARSHRRNAFTLKPGRLSGRLAGAFDLRRPVKPRWPNAGIAQWAPRHGCRGSRAGPWMALRGGPTEQCLRSGTPSLSEVPSGGGKSVLVTFALFKSDPL